MSRKPVVAAESSILMADRPSVAVLPFTADALSHEHNGACYRARQAPLLPLPRDTGRDWDWE